MSFSSSDRYTVCYGRGCMAWVETSKTHGVCGMLPIVGEVDVFNIEPEETDGPVNADVA